MKKKNTLILGMGNDILTDDGIGPRLVHDLSEVIKDTNVHFETACCGGLEIMEYIKGYDQVVFIDAIRTHNGNPGDVHNFIPSDFRETLHLSNLHDIGFLTALKLGKILNMNLPVDVHILAIEIIEDMEFSEEFTIPLKEKYPDILENVLISLRKILL